jgi:hypothetical protein
MADGLETLEPFRPAGIEFDNAHRIRLPAVFGAHVAAMPGRANAADKIKRSIELIGQIDRDLPFPQTESVVRRFGV